MKQLTNLDLSKNELQNAVLQPLATAPSSPKLGQMYYDTTDKVIKSWNGTAWEASSGGAGTWSELTGKPFSTIGDGLSVVGDALVADGIPTITITASQVIGQNPITLQFSEEQTSIIESVESFVIDATSVNFGKFVFTNPLQSGKYIGCQSIIGGDATYALNGLTLVVCVEQEDDRTRGWAVLKTYQFELLQNRVDDLADAVETSYPSATAVVDYVADQLADYTTTADLTDLLADKADVADLADYVKKDGTVAMTGALAMGTHKITGLANGTNSTDAVTLGQMGDAIAAVEAKQLYATAAQGSFATKAALTGATTFYNADGTVATPTKNDVAYVLADESHDGKSAKYVIASTSPIVWGFVIAFSDVTFTQAQMNTINSGLTAADKTKLDGLTAVKTATGSLTAGTTSKSVSYTGTVIGTIVKDASGNEVIVDVAIAASSVTFTVAQAAAAALTCIVIYL